MIIEIDVKEKWEIGEELDDGGYLPFRRDVEHMCFFRGEWTAFHPTNPQLRAAVEQQWEKLREAFKARELAKSARVYGNIVSVTVGEREFKIGDLVCIDQAGRVMKVFKH